MQETFGKLDAGFLHEQIARDPGGIEGAAGTVAGLGLLAVDTVLTGAKQLRAVTGVTAADQVPFTGYEMHVGQTSGADRVRPLVRFADGRTDGATSGNGRVAGTYAHGFFADDRQRQAWVTRLGGILSDNTGYEATVEATLDSLAKHLETHLDIAALLRLAR